jgi:hypothetical protein
VLRFLGGGFGLGTSRPIANSLHSRIDLRMDNTEKGRLKELDKTIYLSIVGYSVFLFL